MNRTIFPIVERPARGVLRSRRGGNVRWRSLRAGRRLLFLISVAAMVQCAPVHFGHEYLALRSQSGAQARTPSPVQDAAATARAPQTAAPASPAVSARLACAAGALTCVHIERPPGVRGAFPVTFGLPFAPGSLRSGSGLVARTAGGATIPVQIDEPATYDDRSLRFAVLSMLMPNALSDGIVSLFVQDGAAGAGTPVSAAAYLAAGHDTRVVLNLYSAQISSVLIGNRSTPFKVGETITLRLGNNPADTYNLTITTQTASGSFNSNLQIAVALVAAINQGPRFHASNIDELVMVTTTDPHALAFTTQLDTTSAVPIQTTLVQAWEPLRRYTASTRAMLQAQQGSLKTWLAGPITSEFKLTGALLGDDGNPHPRLNARMNVRVFPQGVPQTRADVVVEDLWTYDPGARNWQYDLEIDQDGTAVYTQANVTHYHHSRWHKAIWSNGGGTPIVQYDRHYFLNSHAVPHYDEALTIPSSVLNQQTGSLAGADTKPMGNAFITQYFGTTGGRPDIGPLPRWTALYLLSMDPGAESVMLANGDASGSIPIHYRDRATDLPVSIDDHPGIVTAGWPPAEPADAITPGTPNWHTPWSPETAHQPSLTYVPYLITGDEYYMSETQFWANWNLGSIGPGTSTPLIGRGRNIGIIVTQDQQRGQAWGLRSLAEAAAITPDRDPMKSYFTSKLANNIKFALDRYAKRSNPIGLDAVFINDDHFAPWQHDFLTLTVSQLVAFGYSGADTWLSWLAEFGAGRFNNEQNGFCRMTGPSPVLKMRLVAGSPLIASWRELSKVNYPDVPPCPTVFPAIAYDGSSLGYVVNAMAAMATLTDSKLTGAREAYNFLDERERRVNFGNDPTWRIVPR